MDDFICRRLRIPNQLDVIMLVNGAITELLKYSNYEPFGDMPPEEVTQMFTEMWLDFIESDACMIGQVAPFATGNIPEGWLECDGGIYEREAYPALYAVLHPDLLIDVDSFRTPDLVGRFVMGGTGDMGFYPAHETGGEETHTLTVAEMPVHGHIDSGHSHPVHDHLTALAVVPGEVPVNIPSLFPGSTGLGQANIQSTGGGDAHNNIPPYYTLRYFICYR